MKSTSKKAPVTSAEVTPEEKKKALSLIMRQNTGKADWNFPEDMLGVTGIWKLEVEELSCKEHA